MLAFRLNRIVSKTKFGIFNFFKEKSVWTKEKTVKSPYSDVIVPDCTISEYVWMNMEKWPTKTAVICASTKRSYTYEEVYKLSQVFGATLRAKLNIKDGDTVAVMLPNLPEFPIVIFGILAAGGIITTVNPIYTAFEVEKQFLLSEIKLVIAHPDVATVVTEALKNLRTDVPIICINIDSYLPNGTISYKEIIENENINLNILKEVKRKANDIAILLYSSGTTGLPKGVELTNKNILSNFKQLDGDCIQHRLTTDSHQDSVLVILPLFHSYALSFVMLHKLSAGLKLVIMNKFQPDAFLKVLLDHELTMLYLVPPLVSFLGSHPQITPKHFEHVHTVTWGAAHSPEADINKFLEKAGNRNIQFTQAYGLTETSPVATLGPQGFKDYRSVGFAVPNSQLRIVDEESNNLGPNEFGEMLIRGPHVMKGYKNNPEANKEVFLGDGWLRSGDIARIDETGKVYIADRLKEIIKVKAYQVAPAELESVLKDHPAVFDAAVIGIPDPVTGETPRAFVVLNEGCEVSDKDIMDFVRERVAPYKIIKVITFLDSIPKNQSGKVLRRVLKENYS